MPSKAKANIGEDVSPVISKGGVSSDVEPKASTMSETEKEKMKRELREELKQEMLGDAKEREEIKKEVENEVKMQMVQDMDAHVVKFVKTIVEGSAEIADKLNAQPKVICLWELEEGIKKGYLEEVKIGGAVARIPRGVTLYAPISVAESFMKYRKSETEVGLNIPNRQGGTNIRLDRDEVTKSRLS